jgi:DNA-binding transcriptional ArsR family regulator
MYAHIIKDADMVDIAVESQTACCDETLIHDDQVRLARAQLVDDETASQLASTFQALADPTRVRLISILSASDLCVCDLADVLGMSQSAVSHQLRSLRDQRLVRARKMGREVFYSLDDDHIADLYQRGLEHIRHSVKNNQ